MFWRSSSSVLLRGQSMAPAWSGLLIPFPLLRCAVAESLHSSWHSFYFLLIVITPFAFMGLLLGLLEQVVESQPRYPDDHGRAAPIRGLSVGCQTGTASKAWSTDFGGSCWLRKGVKKWVGGPAFGGGEFDPPGPPPFHHFPPALSVLFVFLAVVFLTVGGFLAFHRPRPSTRV